MDKQELIRAIQALKKEKNAIILAHYYTNPDVQELADFIGDSLELSRKAATTSADVIVFAGVHFMAETAAVISPDKKVYIPIQGAGCSLADGVTGADLRAWKEQNPHGVVVSYVNTTAEVKSETDCCCTSANALQVVQSIPTEHNIFFVPDKNLGGYIAAKTGRKMDIFEANCYVHHEFTTSLMLEKIAQYPLADLLIHPESACSHDPLILEHPHCYLYSTSGMLRHVQESPKKQFVIATEIGILHKLRKENPGKEFIPVSERAICKYMKLVTPENLYESLTGEKYLVQVEPQMAERALLPIQRMMAL